jgi:methylenetetrahydrofolate reductase (NADPH)
VTTATLSSAALSSAVQGFSIESVPQDADRIDDFREHIPVGTRVYIAWPPKATPEAMVAAAGKIRSQGMVPVPHIAARRVPSEDFLRAFLQDLVDQAQVNEVLVIGGDPATAEGPYPDTASLLRSGLLGEFGIEKVGVAAHPEGHPVMSEELSREVLAENLAAAREGGLSVEAVSQFVLDPQAIDSWHETVYTSVADGAPLQIGIPGLVSGTRLLKIANACGIGESIGLLRKNGLRIAKTAIGNSSTRNLVEGLAPLANRTDDVGFHFYTFGNFEQTAAWACEVAGTPAGATA